MAIADSAGALYVGTAHGLIRWDTTSNRWTLLRAFSFDGQAFEVAPVDPEPGSRVLAVLRDPSGNVMAIHRGAADAHLRLSRVDAGRWTPIGFEPVQVPEGAPELSFADFAPDGHLWVGLGYVDKDKDRRDYGAAEIVLDDGKVPATARTRPLRRRRPASPA